jgi:hypothetical protein
VESSLPGRRPRRPEWILRTELPVQLFEFGQRNNTGHYTDNVEQLGLSETAKSALELEGARLQIVAAPDSYYAWYLISTGFVFGIAGRGDDYNDSWQYAADEPPQGGPGEDDRWAHVVRDPSPLEW